MNFMTWCAIVYKHRHLPYHYQFPIRKWKSKSPPKVSERSWILFKRITTLTWIAGTIAPKCIIRRFIETCNWVFADVARQLPDSGTCAINFDYFKYICYVSLEMFINTYISMIFSCFIFFRPDTVATLKKPELVCCETKNIVIVIFLDIFVWQKQKCKCNNPLALT